MPSNVQVLFLKKKVRYKHGITNKQTNMSLKYSKNAVIKSFSASNEAVGNAQFADDVTLTPLQRVDEINTQANNCRWWYEPTFADESKYLPVSKQADADAVVVVAGLTTPPNKSAEDNELMNVLLVGLGVFVIYKLLS